GNADTIGDNIVIGQDGNGGSTREFYNQARTLTVTNNAALRVSAVNLPPPPNPLTMTSLLGPLNPYTSPTNPYTSPLNPYTPAALPNRILFDTNVTQVGMAEKALARDNATSFVDNYGTITGGGSGTVTHDLPIRKVASRPHLAA